MKRKLKLPILLLAVVIMLSVFYIKEANSNGSNSTPANSDDLTMSALNPEFTEARLLGIEEANAQIQIWEEMIASGDLSADEVLETSALIDDLRDLKHKEVSLEEVIMDELSYDDVLVVAKDSNVYVDVYTDNEITKLAAVKIAKLAQTSFGTEYTVRVEETNIYE